MEIKVKLSDIVVSKQALDDLVGQRPVAAVGFQIGRAIKIIVGELESYEMARNKLIEKHGGVANQQTNQFEFKDFTAFNNEYAELLSTAITLNVDRIKLSGLSDCKPTVATMMQLAWLIDDDTKENGA